MHTMRSVIVALLATLTPVAASIATAQDTTQDPGRQQRMDAAYQDYHNNPSASGEGPAARTEESIKRGMHKTGQAIKHGAQKTGQAIKHGAEKTEDAVERGAHKTKEAMHKAGQKMKGASEPS